MIDCHCHILPEEIVHNLARYGEKDEHFASLLRTKGAAFKTAADLLRDMDTHSLEKAVVFGFAFKDTGISRMINEYVVEACEKSGGRLVGLGCVSPESPGAMEEAERCLSSGLHGFGELFPAGHGFSLLGQGMRRLSCLCKEAGVPLLIHINEKVGHYYPGKGDVGPEEAYAFASENKDVTIIYAHFGGGLPFYYYMPEVKALENVYYDTAAQPLLYDPMVYQSLKLSGAIRKVLLGSDYPLLSWNRYKSHMQKAGLLDDDINEITVRQPLSIFGEFFLNKERGN